MPARCAVPAASGSARAAGRRIVDQRYSCSRVWTREQSRETRRRPYSQYLKTRYTHKKSRIAAWDPGRALSNSMSSASIPLRRAVSRARTLTRHRVAQLSVIQCCTVLLPVQSSCRPRRATFHTPCDSPRRFTSGPARWASPHSVTHSSDVVVLHLEEGSGGEEAEGGADADEELLGEKG